MDTILLGVTGSIAAYKAAELANQLVKAEKQVKVIMTQAAQQFITPLTFQTLTHRRVYTDLFDGVFYEDVRHIALAREASLVLVAPASADIIAKLACGIADDMLSTVLLAVDVAPVVVCPAMNTAMYEHPATQHNLATLKARGVRVVGPRDGHLACGASGRGAMASVEDILAAVDGALASAATATA
jgi:phosphopantothenoylcysteine decarboxylase/phosphopantothenoylcysteine decarboxylase/phosphopantothenate--cysteine ligase